MIQLRTFAQGALALACGLSTLAFSRDSNAAPGIYEYAISANYYYSSPTAPSSTYRGSEGYLAIWLTDSTFTMSGNPVIYLCSSGATAIDCARNTTYNRSQLLSWLSVVQGAVYSRKRILPQYGTCVTGAYSPGCPVSLAPRW